MNRTMTSSVTNTDMIDAVVVPHPFAVERIHRKIAAGAPLSAIIGHIQPDGLLARHAHVYLNETYVPQKNWPRVTPKPGTILTIRMVPMGGGGGKNPLRTVLSLAIMAASPAIAAGLGGYMGAAAEASFMGVNVGRLVTTGVNLLGRLALNAIAPPGRPRFAAGAKESPALFIQGARNRVTPFGRVPKVLGRHRMVPPLGALPYTETVGNDQYLRMLFVWGYGPLEISDLKIGETPLSEFDGVEIETRYGHESDAPLTLYSNSVLQNDMDINIRHADNYILRASEAEADEISVDITLPRGLMKFNKKGAKVTSAVQVEIQYSPTGENDWSAGAESFKSIGAQTGIECPRPAPHVRNGTSHAVTRLDRVVIDRASGRAKIIQGKNFRNGIDEGAPKLPAVPPDCHLIAKIERRSDDAPGLDPAKITDQRDTSLFGSVFGTSGDFALTAESSSDIVTVAAGSLKFPGISLSGKQSSALRKSVVFKVPTGQYDVRLRRLTADAADDNTFNETVWTALRTLRYTRPVTMKGLAMTALRIRATDQLNGVVDRFNGVVQAILPDWNGTEWVAQATSNPASLYRHVLQGAGNARPLSDNRLDLGKIQAWHTACAEASREFNAVIDYDVSLREVLRDIAACGRASPALLDGKWAVVQDMPQSVPVQHFTPHNTFGFQGQKNFDDIPHALRLRFINRDKGWLQDERLVYDEGYDSSSATSYETMDLTGVTDSGQAWRDGRYHIATARLRPESFSFYCDIEHIVCTRGDLIRFTHDVPLFGLASGRVKSLTQVEDCITAVTLNTGVAMTAGKSYALRFRKQDGSTLVSPVITAAGATAALAFETPLPVAQAPAAGDLAMFGESGQESVELVVKSIEPQSNLNARITCVAAAPGVHTADTAAIPAFSSQITVPPEMQRPPAPVLTEIQSGEECMVRNADGSLTTRVIITLAPPSFSGNLHLQTLIRGSGETSYRPAEALSQSSTFVSITDVVENEEYDIRISYRNESGVFSEALTLGQYRVVGATSLPSDVGEMNMNVLGSTAYLSWRRVTDIDLDHYTLRFSPEISGAAWGGSTDIITHIPADATSATVPAASGAYLLKAIDIGGRQSRNAAIVLSNIAGMTGYNAIETLAEHPGFPGGRENLEVHNNSLLLAAMDGIDDWEDVDNVENSDLGNSGLASEGIYSFAAALDLGAVYTSRLTAALAVGGVDFNTAQDMWEDIDAVEDWDQDLDQTQMAVILQVRTTADDPEVDPAWSAWMQFTVGDYSARAFSFRVLLRAYVANVTPAVTGLTVNIDMPDRTASGQGLVSDAGGSTIAFDQPFHATPAIALTAQSMGTGDYYTITSPTAAGFTLRFYNAAGAGISRNFDYMATGYGQKL